MGTCTFSERYKANPKVAEDLRNMTRNFTHRELFPGDSTTGESGKVISHLDQSVAALRQEVGPQPQIAVLRGASAGINLIMTDGEREDFLSQLDPVLERMGFTLESPASET
jgi:hypothetical protein